MSDEKPAQRRPWPIWLRLLLVMWLSLTVAIVQHFLREHEDRPKEVTCIMQGVEYPCGGPLVAKAMKEPNQ